ncbi:hypothetical protein DRJ16_05155 [Candidatus Woesearchaeota archaeon]|nr:MAG: hypothetical protein DRJ16_05155 [Candidatus Woesearchaeota archaeon]
MRRYVSLSILIIIFSATSLLVMVPSTDDFSLYNPLWNGASKIREIYGFEYIHLSDLRLIPPNSIVFIFPSQPINRDQSKVLAEFLDMGGIIVLMDEYGYSNGFLYFIGSEINVTFHLLRDPLYKWRSSELPYAWISLGDKTLKICLNYASTLQVGNGRVLGLSSYFSFLDEDLDGLHDADEPAGRMCNAASCRHGKGLLIVFSDSSVFLNSMLDLGENRHLLEELIKGRKPYILEDTLRFGAYTLLRESIASACLSLYNLMFYSSISYLLIFLTAISVFYTARTLYLKIQKRYIGPSYRDRLYKVMRLHPSWDRKVLMSISSEVFEGFEPDRED